MPRRKRIVREGYPYRGKFETRAELEEYRAGEKIVCLLCGQEYKILDTHLRAQHGIDSDDYRTIYGIPYLTALTPKWRTDRDSQRMSSYLQDNPEEKEKRTSIIKSLPTPPLRHKTKPSFWKAERTQYGKEVWYEFGKRVMSGRTTSEVSRDSDMPDHATSGVAWARRRYPDFGKWWAENVEPVRVSGRGKNLTAEGRKASEQNEAKT